MTDKDAFGEWLEQPSKLSGYNNRDYLYQQAYEGITGTSLEVMARDIFAEGVWYSTMVDEL